jgi:hypothetical protein
MNDERKLPLPEKFHWRVQKGSKQDERLPEMLTLELKEEPVDHLKNPFDVSKRSNVLPTQYFYEDQELSKNFSAFDLFSHVRLQIEQGLKHNYGTLGAPPDELD